jgi:toxin ParE1/3/4
MARVLRTASAEADVLAIAEYIARDKPSAAEDWVEELDRILAQIAQSPLIGENVEYLVPGMRRHCFGRYLLFYVPVEGGIEFRRLLHGARKIESLF